MEDRKVRNTQWLSVPQFGDWDQKGVLPDYSMDFSKIREMRKQNKRDPSRASLGTRKSSSLQREEIPTLPTVINTTIIRTTLQRIGYIKKGEFGPLVGTSEINEGGNRINLEQARRSFLSYFNCCVKA
ncbi:UNVERIFIED_CONTAM: hypothetical protein Scaly_0006200 [Sesamum calycinum]|uniref:RIN4 pathogenic type III effector avirulence factor Avr cleavage site domain-containing protein n=1 Tax=Sesamum calycinum TaxID=2727403 RepID=A0AAW2ST54_9LAMI